MQMGKDGLVYNHAVVAGHLKAAESGLKLAPLMILKTSARSRSDIAYRYFYDIACLCRLELKFRDGDGRRIVVYVDAAAEKHLVLGVLLKRYLVYRIIIARNGKPTGTQFRQYRRRNYQREVAVHLKLSLIRKQCRA